MLGHERRAILITIKQIAALANVSRGTVDSVINERGGVNKEVAERVRKIADELGYKPNKAAKALATIHKPITIGLVLPASGNPFFDEVKSGFLSQAEELSDYGVTFFIKHLYGYDDEDEINAIDELLEKNISGLIIAPIDTKPMNDKLTELMDKNIPVITINSDITDGKRLCYVGQDYIKSGAAAAGIFGLISNVSLKVGIITGCLNMLGHNQRISGFKDAIDKNYKNIEVIDIVENSDDDRISNDVTKQLINKHSEINAIYMTAGGVCGTASALKELGLDKKIILITYDDVPKTVKLINEGVVNATICQEPLIQGSLSLKLLFEFLVNRTKPADEKYFTKVEIKIKENLG